MSPPLAAGIVARRTLLTLLISAAGGALAMLLHLPAPWLMGGAVAVASAALAGVRVMLPNWLRDITFVMTGLSMGASVARDSLTLMVQWPVTLAALVLELILIITLTGAFLRRVFKLDAGTAYLSSFPGHLSFVMAMAAAGVGDPRQIVIIQVIRLLMLTVFVPIGALFLPLGPYVAAAGAPEIPVPWIAGVAVACGITGLVFARLRMPAAFALGAMATSISFKLLGWFDGVMPPWLLTGVFIFVGALIGSRFAGITAIEFRQAVAGGLAGTLVTVGIVTAVALAVTPLVDMPFGQIWLGLSPGAIEGMGSLGIALGFDVAFIAAHHVGRLLLLTFAIPLVASLVRSRDNR